MSLVPDYEDSSEESDGPSPPPSPAAVPPEPCPPADRLPTPGFISAAIETRAAPGCLPSTTSVFTNPFIEAELAKRAILEKHVKMVNGSGGAGNTATTLNGKKICWNYRKGRCRFGHNCKYAHDSDIQKTKEQLDLEHQMQQTVVCQTGTQAQPTVYELNQIREDSTVGVQKRKRPGLTQGLVPGKKVMKNYMNQRKST